MSDQKLDRVVFTTSRLLEFFTTKELQMQIGFEAALWPLVLLKELIDNALDACETADVVPEITVILDGNAMSVQDNGPGLPVSTLMKSLDYAVRVSDKSHYVSPTRGQLGNALKCVWAAPFVISGEHGRVEVHTAEGTYQIDVTLDRIEQQPKLEVTESEPVVKTGTIVKIHWPEQASSQLQKVGDFYNLVERYAAFNPHVTFYFGSQEVETAVHVGAGDWSKWLPSQPTPPHWYSPERLRALIAAYIADERNGGTARTVREFVSEFKGLSSSAKQKTVTETVGLSGASLHDLVSGDDVNQADVSRLLATMQVESRPVKAAALGIIGQDALTRWLSSYGNVTVDSMTYAKKVSQADDGLPYVIEVAFGVQADYHAHRETIVGLNWTPALKNPLSGWHHELFSDAMIDSYDPVTVIIHIACPQLEFTDRGKSVLAMPDAMYHALADALKKAAKGWAQEKRQMRREQRLSERAFEQAQKRQRRRELSIKDAAYYVIEQAYNHASSNGVLPANARQVMYAARPLVLELTGGKCWKNSNYFTQQLLPDYVNDNPETTDDWYVIYDARGHLLEPHTGYSVDLGTLAVRDYIDSMFEYQVGLNVPTVDMDYPTRGPVNRYRYVLFIEKEGFYEILKEARLSERYDIGIMSTKGMSVTAARQLVEALTNVGVTILVARDFDKAGFSIQHTLGHDTRRHQFMIRPDLRDLGLRLPDVQTMGLQSEYVTYRAKKDPRRILRKRGATAAECDFLVRQREHSGWSGDRVELNAMTSQQFVGWLETKFANIGVEKVVPDIETLVNAYRRAARLNAVQAAINQTVESFDMSAVAIPDNLEQRVADRIKDSDLSWDEAIHQVIKEQSALKAE